MIQSTSNIGFNRTDAVATPANKGQRSSTPASENGDRLDLASTDSLKAALNNTPEIRPDVVARGKELAVDLNYPPRRIIEQLAKLMVESRDPSN
jgi:hypothetical protein